MQDGRVAEPLLTMFSRRCIFYAAHSLARRVCVSERAGRQMRVRTGWGWVALVAAQTMGAQTPAHEYGFGDARAVLDTYCQTCHQGKSAAGHLDLTHYKTQESVTTEPQVWSRI